MRIRVKIILVLLVFAVLASTIGYLTVLKGKQIIQQEIGTRSLFLAQALMIETDQTIHMRVEELTFYSNIEEVYTFLAASNNLYETMQDKEEYRAAQNRAWKENESSLIQNITENEIARELRVWMNVQGIGDEKGQNVFSEIIITDKYGQSIVQTTKEEKLNFEEDTVWKKAAKNKVGVDEVEYNNKTEQYTIRVAIPIDDEKGVLQGIIMAHINIDEVRELLAEAEKSERLEKGTKDIKLITKEGRIVYATEKIYTVPLQSINDTELFSKIKAQKGYEKFSDEEGEEIFSYVRSEGYNEYPGAGWILIVEHKSEEVLGPIIDLQRIIGFASLILVLGALGVGTLISFSISRPLTKITKHAVEIGKGNLEKSDINRNDELGTLAQTLDTMTTNLKEYQNKLLHEQNERGQILEKEVNSKTKELQQYIEKLERSRTATLNILRDLKESNQHLRDVDKAKSDFLNIISHELKTPLTAMFAYLDIAEDSKEHFTKEIRDSFTAVRRNSEQLHGLINNILEVSRIEAGKFELIFAEINVREKVEAVVKNLTPLADNNKNKLIAKFGDLPKTMITDEQRFDEVMNNLISNAIKFTENGTIEVTAQKKDDFLLVSVKDTGVGIPKDKIKNLFQKFYQVDASVSRRYGGTGLGLSITKSLIELQGGTIKVESKEGKGSTFSFTLPLKPKKENGSTK